MTPPSKEYYIIIIVYIYIYTYIHINVCISNIHTYIAIIVKVLKWNVSGKEILEVMDFKPFLRMER